MEFFKNFFKKKDTIQFIIGAILILSFRGSVYNWYSIPTGSMQPTIKISDHIGVNRLAHGLIFPGAGRQLINWGQPQRGEIVIFESVDTKEMFVKRVVGLPRDHIRFDRGRLVINGDPVWEEVVRQDAADILSDVEYGDRVILYREQLPGEKGFHFIQRQDPSKFDYLALTDAREYRSWEVPEDSFFLLGDNRSFSEDSRYWKKTPFLKTNQILGRGDRVLYSFYRKKHFFDFRFRKGRFFLDLDALANSDRWK